MNQSEHGRIDVVARVTLGVLPNICMLLILATVCAYFWAQYRTNAKLAEKQGIAIDAAIVEGRAFHHRDGKLLRRIAIRVGIPPAEVEGIVPESTLEDTAQRPNDSEVRPVWLAF